MLDILLLSLRNILKPICLVFLNILDLAKQLNVKKILYASSSSVYGDSKKFPLKETEELNPKHICNIKKIK